MQPDKRSDAFEVWWYDYRIKNGLGDHTAKAEVALAAYLAGVGDTEAALRSARPEEQRIEKIRAAIGNMTRYGCVGPEGDYDAGMEPGAGDYIDADAVLALFDVREPQSRSPSDG